MIYLFVQVKHLKILYFYGQLVELAYKIVMPIFKIIIDRIKILPFLQLVPQIYLRISFTF